MKVHLLLATALLLTAGCTGLPAGSADFGDTVMVRYTVEDAGNGTVLRAQRTATFVLGSGSSGLGLAFERELRGTQPGDNRTFTVHEDPSLDFQRTVTVSRDLPPVDRHQDAPRDDFEDSLGPATVGMQFPAFTIYTATVTGVSNDTVDFRIDLKTTPTQRDPVGSVGAILVSTQAEAQIQRRLEPNVGATFTINPPTQFNPQTPLGLAPGTYRTLGATDTQIEYGFSTSSSVDLIGKDLRFRVNVVRVTADADAGEPVCEEGKDGKPEDCNYVHRRSPYLNGDPATVLESDGDGSGDGHGDGH